MSTHSPNTVQNIFQIISKHGFLINQNSFYRHTQSLAHAHSAWAKSQSFLGKAVTYNECSKLKRDFMKAVFFREKDWFQSGISLHFQAFVVPYGFSRYSCRFLTHGVFHIGGIKTKKPRQIPIKKSSPGIGTRKYFRNFKKLRMSENCTSEFCRSQGPGIGFL